MKQNVCRRLSHENGTTHHEVPIQSLMFFELRYAILAHHPPLDYELKTYLYGYSGLTVMESVTTPLILEREVYRGDMSALESPRLRMSPRHAH